MGKGEVVVGVKGQWRDVRCVELTRGNGRGEEGCGGQESSHWCWGEGGLRSSRRWEEGE